MPANRGDLTVCFYTANAIDKPQLRGELLDSLGDIPLISVSHQPMAFGQNIVVDLPRHHLSIYKQALVGAKAATTPYIALVEDDALYTPEHFEHRPSPGKFAYNLSHWGIYSWNPTLYSWKGRRTLWNLICERELFIEAMEERFANYKMSPYAIQREDGVVDLSLWAEPGKYERQLGVTVRETETFWTNPPNVVFSHENALAYNNLGKRKRLGELRAIEVPFWGRAEDLCTTYQF